MQSRLGLGPVTRILALWPLKLREDRFPWFKMTKFIELVIAITKDPSRSPRLAHFNMALTHSILELWLRPHPSLQVPVLLCFFLVMLRPREIKMGKFPVPTVTYSCPRVTITAPGWMVFCHLGPMLGSTEKSW